MSVKFQRWVCAVAATGLLVGGLVVTGSSAASAATETYEQTPYSSTVWRVVLRDVGEGRFIAVRTALSLSMWRQAGYPAPVAVPTIYSRLPWSPTITASAVFGGWTTYREDLNENQWARAGYPAPAVADANYVSYQTAPNVYADAEFTPAFSMSYDQWAYAGYPEPLLTSFGFVRYAWSPRIFRISDFETWVGTQITFSQWGGLYTYSPPALVGTEGSFVQTPGEEAIFYVDGETEFQVTFDEWAAAGYPTPVQP